MEKYMKRALQLARLGLGHTNPNPLVGAVIVKNGRIIGEGYHEYYGGPHAEINALKSVKEDVKGAQLYVTLEPCCHYGKTPPCVDAIVKSGIKDVYIAMEDPNKLVSGKGIKHLKEAGLNVYTGLLKEQAEKVNEIFIKYITTKKPYVILKSAMTIDGKIATITGDSKWITNEKSREHVHMMRGSVMAIMVGINTVIKDNPYLTTRIDGLKNPLRVIVDSRGRIPLDANVVIDKSATTIVATTDMMPYKKVKALRDLGVDVVVLDKLNGEVDLKKLMDMLGERGIDSVIIEGGGTLNYSALKEGIVDKVMFYIAPKIIGGSNSLTPVEGKGIDLIKDAIIVEKLDVKRFDDDILIEGYIKK
ncbi:bifunctional diaminohydroxyphosphoribosylaminopyrimidine deaminase/5-amino-6-(5-phosphoribosylamino)uracil reductase RibD [Thermoanaerobacterium sp. CMT5567-10]|uniref:bifunctional diaminohydroxyphosphoribosylaminopyrimidine deaminase/5-amino-6-(5-phosphoribosylamino)uracil reductase RibD n=1 Tax=Thermoanaerobacterium sp. CMT5567-10 TaxID=3061989 RepID=UPI0026E0AF4C|nr:bifunctional diaminohydroxyphosphoribosylaminopyrimidine deaminase/5-amino-6-(5-phosphoribosylamino)uracil reductase RibD [Thermoanaerobacterium sp. CMT5567-10]WKV07625.1 bifunctional diaminohydroxyphosphoribosylaminopyrimidine deaminase/5-amino-6-(5-phosphoribosylamino)uracil reductase RibD [Thermoanaerobacterium sp. CMT5567-10]